MADVVTLMKLFLSVVMVMAMAAMMVFSFVYAAPNPIQRIIDCRNPANSGQCAGNPNLINGNLRNMGQPGMTARIQGHDIFQSLCISLGVSCAGSYDTASLQTRIRQLQLIQSNNEEMRRNAPAAMAALAEARRRADAAARAAAARMVTTGQFQEPFSGGSTQVNLCFRFNKIKALCERFGCSWDPRGGGQCVEAE